MRQLQNSNIKNVINLQKLIKFVKEYKNLEDEKKIKRNLLYRISGYSACEIKFHHLNLTENS